jgi:acyl-CoA dehydrogenase-like protein
MDAGERALLAKTVFDAVSARPDAADAVLHDLGWLDMLDAETAVAIAVVFDALGRTNAAATALDDVMLLALGFEPRADLCVVLPGGIATARITVASNVVVGIGTVPIESLRVTPIRGVDPDARLFAVDVDRTTVAGSDTALGLARRALAHQLAGACHSMLDLARGHALERVQFGRPIARFQAVRHRLADALVAVEALDAALDAAADEPGPQTAALAKAIAGNTARTVAAHCQQVLAGIGFTTDHPFHRSFKRTIVLDALLGSADDLTLALGRALLRTRTVPTLIDLEGSATSPVPA